MSQQQVQLKRRQARLQQLGIGPLWVIRNASLTVDESSSAIVSAAPSTENDYKSEVAVASAWDTTTPAQHVPLQNDGDRQREADIASMDWPALQAEVANCTRCDLCKTRSRTVFGTGDLQAKWLFVGEGPGRSEDQQGEPFVGPAGKLLDNMLQAIALDRTRFTYIANVVKCRPVDADGRDRAPTPSEAAACRPFLERQIALLRPDTIVALGKVAAVTLLARDPTTAVGDLRGIVHAYKKIPLVVTYHPAYLLRKPLDKSKSWRDLCLAVQAINHPGSPVD